MPLSIPQKPKPLSFTGVRSAITNILARLNINVFLLIFLVVGMLAVILKSQAIGFYIIFGLFVTGYFTERITIIFGRNTRKRDNTE